MLLKTQACGTFEEMYMYLWWNIEAKCYLAAKKESIQKQAASHHLS
jgi:hypothetical protein